MTSSWGHNKDWNRNYKVVQQTVCFTTVFHSFSPRQQHQMFLYIFTHWRCEASVLSQVFATQLYGAKLLSVVAGVPSNEVFANSSLFVSATLHTFRIIVKLSFHLDWGFYLYCLRYTPLLLSWQLKEAGPSSNIMANDLKGLPICYKRQTRQKRRDDYDWLLLYLCKQIGIVVYSLLLWLLLLLLWEFHAQVGSRWSNEDTIATPN